MFYFYIIISAALIPFLNNFFVILRQPYSWWLVPLLFIGFIIAFIILQLSVLAISAFAVNLKSSQDSGSSYYRFLTVSSINLLMKIVRIKINLKGREKVPKDQRVLLVCNHQNDLDPIMLLSALPELELGFIGKKEIYKTKPLIGRLMHKLHCLPIDRENNREAVKTIIEAIKLLKQDKVSIGLFPEGYTSKTCELLPFRNGAFKIAYKAEVPIVICVINNTRSVVKRMFRHRTDIEIHILDVLYPGDFKDLNTIELGNKIHDMMKSELEEIRK